MAPVSPNQNAGADNKGIDFDDIVNISTRRPYGTPTSVIPVTPIYNYLSDKFDYTPPFFGDTKLPNGLKGTQLKPDSFTVSYKTATGKTKKFIFALLPAIESNVQYSPNTNVRGQTSVPEVKPGIVTATTMKYKMFIVPGGAPIVQTIGIQGTTHTLVGAFIGSEGVTDGKLDVSLDPIYPESDVATLTPPWNHNDTTSNAFNKANYFDQVLAKSGQPVIVVVNSDITYHYTGLIMDFKFYTVRGNRAYYIMNIFSTDYSQPPT